MEYRETISCEKARIHIQVLGPKRMDGLLSDLSFLNYRLAGVERKEADPALPPDLKWDRGAPQKDIRLQGSCIDLTGPWEEGEIQRIIVSLLAKKLVEEDLYPFHASGIRYRNHNIMFMGGESNSGKSMSQIEGCRRGGEILSTETLILNQKGEMVLGSKNVFLKKRAKGTERIDKPDLDQGIALFFDQKPNFVIYDGHEKRIDLVILPDIDGHFATLVGEMTLYEKEYQTFHCLSDYWGDRTLLSSGLPMPLIDTDDLRRKRADFIKRFALRPYFYIRAKTPQIVLDQVEELLGGKR